MALEHGVEGIYVSNHGGRQLDHGKGAIAVLPEVVEAAAGRAQIIVDGGFLRGTDIVKAMALGAHAVGIGRLQGLALAAGGEDALVRALELLEDEVRRCLGLLGVTSYAELDQTYIAPVAPLAREGWDSAFPLLKEGY
jgi:isopentenyl diphosphate isomerase/L-lactate dehydrogenase-like FMN-dependent dehydrogenase